MEALLEKAVTEVLRNEIALSLDELWWLASRRMPTDFSPAGFLAHVAPPTVEAVARGEASLRKRRLVEGDGLKPLVGLAAAVAFDPAISVEVMVERVGAVPQRGIYWSDGALTVQAWLARDGFHLSPPVKNPPFVEWLAARLGPATDPEPRALPRDAFLVATRIGPELGIGHGSALRRDLAALIGDAAVATLVDAGLLFGRADRITAAPDWEALWNALAKPDATTVTIRLGPDDEAPAEVALVGPPGARLRVAPRGATVELWGPGEAGLVEELRASLVAGA